MIFSEKVSDPVLISGCVRKMFVGPEKCVLITFVSQKIFAGPINVGRAVKTSFCCCCWIYVMRVKMGIRLCN